MVNLPKNKLLVEGDEDKRVIPYLMEANGVTWERNKQPVYIESCDGIENILDFDSLSTELKASGLTALGIIIDADDNPISQWERIRNICLKLMPDFPEELPSTGLIHQTNDNIKFGVWMMPNNQLSGMLETFLAYMITDENELFWQYSQEVVKEAQNKNAPFIEKHIDKAYIHTWLAWQNPPGRQLHNAIMERILNPQHPEANNFVNWFKNLYQL